MIYWHDYQGRILQTSSDDTARSGFDHEPGVTRLHAPGYHDPNDYYVVGTSFKPKPAQPSPHHEFDYASKTWQLDLNRAWHAVRRERNGRLAEYAKRKAALGAKDFDDAEAVVLDLLDTTQQGIIVHGSADPALVVYALGTNEDKARELAKIKDPVQFAFAVARLEGQMKVSKNRPATVPEGRVVGERRPAGGDAALERLRAEADKTGDYSKVNAYKRKMAGR